MSIRGKRGHAGDGAAELRVREVITPWDTYEHVAERVIVQCQTKFQHVQLLDTRAFGDVLVLDGICQSSSVDEFIYHETIVHPAMAILGDARNVLVLGGAEGATLREVYRWPTVERATMVDIDEELVALCREHLPTWAGGAFEDPRTVLALGDAVAFLKASTETFDVIIADMSDPVEEGPATFCFTQEFFQSVADHLSPEGVFVLQGGPANPAEGALHAKVLRTLETVFADIESYLCPATIYGRPLGLAMGSRVAMRPRLSAASQSGRVADIAEQWRFLTPAALLGLLGIAPYVRAEMLASDVIFRDDAPPQNDLGGDWATLPQNGAAKGNA
ncbi:MAG: spermidine synthase [Acidimicrobiia bacterium]